MKIIGEKRFGELAQDHAALELELLDGARAVDQRAAERLLQRDPGPSRLGEHEAEGVAIGLRGQDIGLLLQGGALDQLANEAVDLGLQLAGDHPVAQNGKVRAFRVVRAGQARLEPVGAEEVGLPAVDDVEAGVGDVVGEVHHLALDALRREVRPRHGTVAELQDGGLVAVDEMMLQPGREEALVLEHAVEQRARGAHAAAAVAAVVDRAREDAQRLRVALKAAVVSHQRVERALARVAEGRMANVVGEADGLEQMKIERDVGPRLPQPDRDRLGDARDFQRVREARAIEIVLAGLEDLRLGLQPAKGRAEHDAVAVLVEDGAVVRRAFGVEGVAEQLAIERAVEVTDHPGRLAGRAQKAGNFARSSRRQGGFSSFPNSIWERDC
ncbi:MAG: hypothetical protein WDO13_12710 [Verrucomicrobiota bacterium]